MPDRQKIFYSVTPTVDTSAYADGDHLGTLQTLVGFRNYAECILDSIKITDNAQQSIAIDVVFFSSLPTFLSSDNQPFSISNAELGKVLGVVNVITDMYANIGSAQSVASVTGDQVFLRSEAVGSSDTFEVYAQAIARGAGTFAASDLTFKYGLRID